VNYVDKASHRNLLIGGICLLLAFCLKWAGSLTAAARDPEVRLLSWLSVFDFDPAESMFMRVIYARKHDLLSANAVSFALWGVIAAVLILATSRYVGRKAALGLAATALLATYLGGAPIHLARLYLDASIGENAYDLAFSSSDGLDAVAGLPTLDTSAMSGVSGLSVLFANGDEPMLGWLFTLPGSSVLLAIDMIAELVAFYGFFLVAGFSLWKTRSVS
jgi:hypothetical protein